MNTELSVTNRRMNRNLLLLLCLLLAACSDAYAPADPNLAAQDAHATIGAATAIAQSTQDEQRRVEREATREAARTQEASQAQIAVMEASIRTTDAAASIERTSTAIAWGMEVQRTQAAEQAAQKTAQAGATSTAYVQGQIIASKTEVAAQTAARSEANRKTAQTIGVWAIVIIMVIALSIAGNQVLSWFLELQSAKGLLVDMKNGTFLIHPNDPSSKLKDLTAELMAGPRLLQLGPGSIRDAEPEQVFQYDTAGNVLGSPIKTRRINKEWALRLLDDACKMGWENSITLPGHRELPNWSSWAWQEARDYWVYFHVMEMIRMKDPRTNRTNSVLTITHPEFRTVGELRDALENKQLKLYHPIAKMQKDSVT